MDTGSQIKKPDFPLGVPVPFVQLTEIQRTYIDWKALGGIITDDEGTHQLKHKDLAAMLKCSPQWLSSCCNNVPNFWELVEERRREFSKTSRLAHMHRQWYIHASTFKNWQVTEGWLRNFDPSYRESKTKVEVEAGGGLLDLFSRKQKVIEAHEAEIIDGDSDNN